MIIPLTLAALSCSPTTMINQTKDPWNRFDKTVLQKAEVRCGEIYPDAPCVKSFYKRPEQSYWVICKGEKK
jgi:hypothetical protein